MKNVMFRILNPYFRISFVNKRRFHINSRLLDYYDKEKSGYPKIYDGPSLESLSYSEKMKLGYGELKKSFKMLKEEIRSNFVLFPTRRVPEEEDIVWKFDGTEESLKAWIVTCDSDYNEGFSTAKLELSEHGTGVFHGTLDTTVPKDGVTTKAGFCNITTIPKFKSFKRRTFHDWIGYNQLVLRVRGDGRSYMINLLQKGYLDVTWNDTNSYMMFTRGGPHWQVIKIPFSKFFYDYKGILQDHQRPLPECRISNLGITVADKKPGPFRLEIDYIAVCDDPLNTEEFAYELNDISTF